MKPATVSSRGKLPALGSLRAIGFLGAIEATGRLVAIGLLWLFSFAHVATAQTSVGRATLVRGDVQASLPGASAEPLELADDVYSGQQIRTGVASRAELRILGNLLIKIGAEGDLTLDRSVIDQATGDEEHLWSMLRGRIEVALGSLFRGRFGLGTPSAELAVEGTVFRVLVDESGNTFVAVLEGTVEVRSKASDTILSLTEGFWTRIDTDADALPPQPFDLGASELSPTTGGPDFTVPGEEGFGDPPIDRENSQIDPPRQPPGDFQTETSPQEPP